ncbi:MAG: hypothetical protein RR540_00550, partial [Oscillospiraceae bacterium]
PTIPQTREEWKKWGKGIEKWETEIAKRQKQQLPHGEEKQAAEKFSIDNDQITVKSIVTEKQSEGTVYKNLINTLCNNSLFPDKPLERSAISCLDETLLGEYNPPEYEYRVVTKKEIEVLQKKEIHFKTTELSNKTIAQFDKNLMSTVEKALSSQKNLIK